MPKIRAAIAHEFGQPLSIEPITLRPPQAGEVEVDIEACAVCHSDISLLEGGWGGELPAVYGHEAAGRISAVGPGVKGYAIGDTVLVTLIRACAHCAPCINGAPVSCENPTAETSPIQLEDGRSVAQGLSCGAFADRVVVDTSQLAPIPADMPMDAACLLSCGVITGVGAVVNTAGFRAGQIAVVIGAGGVGLNAIQGARIAGASRIIAVDMLEDKLQIARDFGATDTILASAPKPWKILRQITDGRMADAVFVTVGVSSAYDNAPRYLASRGKVILIGLPHLGDKPSLDPLYLASKGQSLIGCKMGDVVLRRDIPWMVELYQQGRLKLDQLISSHWTLEQINQAIDDTRSGAAKRNVIWLKR